MTSADNLQEDDATQYPGFAGWQLWEIPKGAKLKPLLKQQLVALAKDSDGKGLAATAVQFSFALDDVYYEGTNLKNEKLGASFEGGNFAGIKLWAPTASKVEIQIVDQPDVASAASWQVMKYNDDTGVWSLAADQAKDRQYYRYRVTVYRRDTGNVETTTVSDPYSLTVSTNGAFTQIINLDDADLKPANWDDMIKQDPDDIVIYETHIRDISVNDKADKPANNGKYLAFSESERASMKHLQQLQKSGLTHVEVLPAFDLATVDEDPDMVADLDSPFNKLCELNSGVADSEFGNFCSGGSTIGDVLTQVLADDPEKPQALYNYLRQYDSFNWGYDPFHYTVPEGSYASGTDRIARVRDFRAMVKSLNDMGLLTAMDVVYRMSVKPRTLSAGM